MATGSDNKSKRKARSCLSADQPETRAEGTVQVDGPLQPSQPAGSQSDKNVWRLHEELEKELGKLFASKGQGVWGKIRKRLGEKRGIPPKDVQNVDSMGALFRVLVDKRKIQPGNYAFLLDALVCFVDNEKETRTIITNYTARIQNQNEREVPSKTKRKRTGNDQERSKSAK